MGFFSRTKKDADDEARIIESEIMDYMESLSQKHPLVVANTMQKCISKFGFVDNVGFIDLASSSVTNLYYTGDILLKSNKYDLNIGDILEYGFFSERGYSKFYGELKSFNKDGYLNTFDFDIKEELIIIPNQVTGVVSKVISFGENEWYELFEKIINDYSYLREIIEESIDFYENLDDYEDKQNMLEVLNSRLKELDSKNKL